MKDSKKTILILLGAALLIMVFSSVGFLYPYILDYNAGNKAYEEGDYAKAEEKYAQALDGFVPEGKECDIRDNWALAILAQLKPIDEIQDDEIDDTLSELHRASDILTEEGCADEEYAYYAHDYNSQELEEEILEYIRILEERKAKSEDEKNDSKKDEEKNNNSDNSNDNNADNQSDPKDSDQKQNPDDSQGEDQKEEQAKEEGEQQQIQENKQSEEEPEETPQQKLDRERQEKLMQDQKAGTAERNQNLEWEDYSSNYEYYSGKNW